jgi:hypothetical protein
MIPTPCPTCHTLAGRNLGSRSTLMSWHAFTDATGNRHSHNPNRTTTAIECANGHRFEVSGKAPCASCDYPNEPPTVRLIP